jgi:hypothetical protein
VRRDRADAAGVQQGAQLGGGPAVELDSSTSWYPMSASMSSVAGRSAPAMSRSEYSWIPMC